MCIYVIPCQPFCLLCASANELPLSGQNATTGTCEAIDVFEEMASVCGSADQGSQGGGPHSAAQEPVRLLLKNQ